MNNKYGIAMSNNTIMVSGAIVVGMLGVAYLVKQHPIFKFIDSIMLFFVFTVFTVAMLYLYFAKKKLTQELDVAIEIFNEHRDFPEIEDAMEKTLFAEAWHNFDASLIKTNNDASTTVEPEEYFNSFTLVEAQFQLELMRNVPAILTSLGIIGTFAGVLCGLAEFKLPGEIPDPLKSMATVEKSINLLIESVKSAFQTSFWAITGAVIFTFVKKVMMGELYNKVTLLQQAISRLFNRSISDDYLKQMLQQANQQTQMLNSLSQDIADKMEESFDRMSQAQADGIIDANKKMSQVLSENLKPVMTKLLEVMQEVKCTQADAGQTMIAEMIEKFNSSLQGRTNEQMQELLGAVKGTAELLTGLKESMQTLATNISTKADEQRQKSQEEMGRILAQSAGHTQKMQEAFQKFTDDMAKNMNNMQTQMSNNSASAVEQLGSKHIEMIKKTEESFVNAINDLHSLVQTAHKTSSEEFERANGEIVKRAEEVLKAAGDSVATNIAANTTKSIELQGQMATLMTKMEGVTAQNTAFIESARVGIEESMNRISKVVEQAKNLSTEYARLIEQGQELGSSTNQSLSQITMATGKIAETVESYKGIYNQVIEQTEQVSNLIQQIQAIHKSNQGSFNDMIGVHGRVANMVQQLDTSIEQGLKNYVTTVNTSLTGYLHGMQTQLDTLTGGINFNIDELRDSVDELTQAIKDIKK